MAHNEYWEEKDYDFNKWSNAERLRLNRNLAVFGDPRRVALSRLVLTATKEEMDDYDIRKTIVKCGLSTKAADAAVNKCAEIAAAAAAAAAAAKDYDIVLEDAEFDDRHESGEHRMKKVFLNLIAAAAVAQLLPPLLLRLMTMN